MPENLTPFDASAYLGNEETFAEYLTDTVMKVMKALGARLHAEPARTS
ncbi:hypothetical protein EDC61_103127 [Sulfuritortus calidifontis]|uniref:Uncharacterized protein n=1 Tax=Sulfuritortus calidifontis TaxID=1914471 RepID=A0A4R3JXF6_9PROT|nr:hypothetical protein [Sulfuritortus calidifontis]TCS73004.1 hypothetical protein EDC61_103127 [Sulfuritortus calidifontis]